MMKRIVLIFFTLLKSRMLPFLALFFAILHSCAPSKCVLCEIDNSTLYQVEFEEGARTNVDQQTIVTFFTPVPIEARQKKVELYVVDCTEQSPYLLQGDALEQYIKDNIFKIDISQVKQITTTSDADVPPTIVSNEQLESYILCNRFRQKIKLEVRGMLGARPFIDNDGIVYPGNDGDVTYEHGIFNPGVGGSYITYGLEAAVLPRIATFNDRHALNIGLLSGLWPVDGGWFTPVALHPRLTFNEISSPLWGKCNAWYLFGDIGLAYRFSGINTNGFNNIPVFYDEGFRPTSYFYGLGLGFDLWKKRGMDFSVDLGYRFTSLALPRNHEFEQCLIDAGKEIATDYPVRKSNQFFIRFGFTW